MPPIYEELHRFSQLFPLYDREGQDTLWKTAFYDPVIRKDLAREADPDLLAVENG